MILMALDHTRDFFGLPANPTNLATASAALFATRWVTHFCAPGFFLLMGTGAYFAGQRRQTGELVRFLATRGVWLIVLDLVVLRCFAYQFNVDYRVTMLLVLWALGWALISLAAIVWLPLPVIGAIGIALIAGHNLFDVIRSPHPLWRVLHAPGVVFDDQRHVVFAAYPLVPWVGVTMVGYVLGAVYRWPAERRTRLLLPLGIAATVLFVVIRAINRYGDPVPWQHLPASLFTALSFLNTTKYPPSLLFLLMTLGPLLIALALVDGMPERRLQPLVVYGRVPLFYFAVHFFLLHALAALVCLVRYGSAHWMFESPDLANYPFTSPPGWGFTLPVVYGVWGAVVIVMCPLCRWFSGIKRRNNAAWLSYL